MKTSSSPAEPLVQRMMRRLGGGSPEAAIERYADRCLADAGQTKLPVNVELITSVLGIKRRVSDYPFAGRVYADESGQLLMDLNAGDSEPRRRFTCAHELIHTAFPGFVREARYRLDISTGAVPDGRSEEESLCDLGASMLLMPRLLLEGQYRISDGLQAVEKLAEDADVSLEAAGNRLVRLSERPAAFLVLEVAHKPADRVGLRRGEAVEPKLRVRYASLNKLTSYIPRFKSVDDGSIFGRALVTSDHVYGEGQLPGADPRAPNLKICAGSYPRRGQDGEIQRVLAIALDQPSPASRS